MDAEQVSTGTDVGESAPVQETVSAPETDRSEQSPDEILGIGVYEKEPGEVEAETVTAETEPKPVEAQAPAREESPEDKLLADLPSEELKRILAKEPAIRDFYFAEREYRKMFPTVGEARAFREMFPTVEDAQSVMSQAEALLAAERTYQERPEDFIKGIAKGDPEAFKRFASTIPQALYDHDPKLYREMIAEPTITGLFTRLEQGAVQRGDEATQRAIQHLREVLGLGEGGDRLPATDPRIVELEQLKRQAEEAQERGRQEAIQNFDASVLRTFSEGLEGRVSDELKRLNPAMSELAQRYAHDEIVSTVIGKLTENKWLSNQAAQIARSGNYGPDHLKQVTELLAKHANQITPSVVSAVMRKWTEEIVKTNGQQLSKAKEIAGKKEVPVGSDTPRDGNGRFKKVKAGDPMFNKLTPDQILDMEL